MEIVNITTETSRMLNDENCSSKSRRAALREVVATLAPPEKLPKNRDKARQVAYYLLETYVGIIAQVTTFKLAKTPEDKLKAGINGLTQEKAEGLLDYADHIYHVAGMLLVAAYSGYDHIN